MDPEPREVEAQNPPAPTYALIGGAGGTRAMQPRSLESGVEEGEPMDTSLPIAAQNLPGQNVPDAQMANDGQFGAQPQNESRFGDTRAIQPHNEVRLGITTAKMPPNKLSSLERLNTEIVIRIKQDLFDGRLISLDQSQIEDIIKLGEAKELAKTKGAREKLASRILHFGIVPLLAYHDALLTDQSVRFGYDVVHMDIKSLNIVLDLKYNARLIDFGLAREMKEPNAKLFMTSSQVPGTVGYFPTTTLQGLTKFHDYHNFGVESDLEK
ncbi:PBL28-like protein [Mya arenaria]|uniref:PBL28-like protein n=1 Tax=Mya arenaria TaxID=6604 RepID=A0ABY7DW07_MYAAR|nr:PBL28-like protein [Mya arenaria]